MEAAGFEISKEIQKGYLDVDSACSDEIMVEKILGLQIVIESFFEDAEMKAPLSEYLADIRNLEITTTADLHEVIPNPSKSVFESLKGSIIHNLEAFHNAQYSLLSCMLSIYVNEQVSSLNESLATSSLEKTELIKSHKEALAQELEENEEIPNLPNCFIELAQEKFESEANALFDRLKRLEGEAQAQEFAYTCHTFIQERPTECWQTDSGLHKNEQIIGFFTLFLICQDVRSEEERAKLSKLYYSLVNWYTFCVEPQGADVAKIIEIANENNSLKFCENQEEYQAQVNNLREKLMKNSTDYERNCIIWNISAYLLSVVEDDNKTHAQITQPALNHYLYNFLLCLYPRNKAKIQFLLFKKEMYQPFHFKDASTFASVCYQSFLDPDCSYTVDYLKFVNILTQNSKFMSEYCQNLMEESLEKGNYVDHTQLESILLESQRISDKNDCAIAKFECLTPATVHGKDAVIAISGFLSQNNESSLSWKGLINEYHHYSGAPIYSFSWNSSSTSKFVQGMVKSGAKSVSSALITGMKRTLGILFGAVDLAMTARKEFTNSIEMAKISGKLLAHALMVQFPFKDSSISLIGFSLGAQVIYSCLKELKEWDYDHIINNVYFLGGAVSVEDSQEWQKSLSVVNGVTNNCFCTEDYILQLYKATMLKYPIGLGPIMESKIQENGNKQCKSCKGLSDRSRVENHNVTAEAGGHLTYRDNLEQILRRINFVG